MPSAIAKISLAVLGAWLCVMPSSVLTLALRLREFDDSGLPTEYSWAIGAGWLMLIGALVGFGMVGDALERRGRSRTLLVPWAVPLLVVTSVVLVASSTAQLLTVAWIGLQAPVGAVITSALAQGGTAVSVDRRGLLSGLIGASSILALLLGSSVASAAGSAVAPAFLITTLIGATCILPLALRPPRPAAEAPTPPGSRPRSARRWAPAWVAVTVASFLLSWSTATTNSYIAIFVDRLAQVMETQVADVATTAVLGASAVTFLLSSPTPTGIVWAGIAFGAGFGLANGAEL